MAVKTETKKGPRVGSQSSRILDALKDGKWTSINEIHRRAGTSRLNSRVSDLRKQGFKIEHREVKGKPRASLRHQYRLVDRPAILPDPGTAKDRWTLDRDKTPRDVKRRYRIYIVNERNKLLLMATAPTEEKVGVEICRLGRSGQISRACVGVLDSHGIENEIEQGNWIVNPFDAKIT